MLAKLDWMHYALAALATVTILGPGIEQALGVWQMPGAAALVVHIIGFATSLLMLAKQWVDDPIFVQHGVPVQDKKP